MGKTLKDLGLTPNKISELSTPIFRINTDLIGRLFAQDLNLYATLVGDNKYFKETLDLFLNNLSKTSDILCNDLDKRVDYLENIKDFFGDFCEQGLNESNEFLKTVVK
jgi:prephenate dehydrogenase